MINRSLALALPRVFESSIQLTSQNSFFTESSTTESNNLLRNRTENPFDKPSQLYEKEYELIAFIMAGCGLFLILSGSGFIFCNWRIKKQKRLREEALARRRARKEDEIRRARRARRNENYIVWFLGSIFYVQFFFVGDLKRLKLFFTINGLLNFYIT